MASAFDCNQPPRMQFHDPAALVREYVRRDSLGMILEPDVHLLDLVACDLRISGSEYKVLASLKQLVPVATTRDTARFLAIYHVYGETAEAGTGLVFEPAPRTDTAEIVTVHSRWGWRLANFEVPHIAPKAYLRVMRGVWKIKNPQDLSAVVRRTP